MNLYIIRHAIAVQAGTPGYEEDSQRPLTDKGRKKMRKIAQGLRELEAQIDLILTSPYLRAMQTAQILAKVFELGKGKIIVTEPLKPIGHSDKLIDEINERYKDVQGIVLVGHEPYLSNLVSMLVAGDLNMSLTLKKGGVCYLAVETLQYGRCATLDLEMQVKAARRRLRTVEVPVRYRRRLGRSKISGTMPRVVPRGNEDPRHHRGGLSAPRTAPRAAFAPSGPSAGPPSGSPGRLTRRWQPSPVQQTKAP